MKNVRIPYTNLTKEAKLKLAITAIITFYLLLMGWQLFYGNLCNGIAFDYCAFWSSGRIIDEYGYRYIYDSDKLFNIQKEIYPQAKINPNTFEEAFILYLPPFLFPFKLLSKFNLSLSFYVWTIINVLILIAYLKFFIHEMSKEKIKETNLWLVLMSLPFFLNLFYGQVNIWLGIFIGEFIRARSQNKYIKSGMWLGGLLLKPQLLILLIPAFIFKKQLKIILGFLISSLFIGLLTWVMIGKEGLLDLLNIFYVSSQGAGHSNPSAMMNFRMLGIFFEVFSNSTISSFMVILGTASTLFIALLVFSRRHDFDSFSAAIFISGLLAATCLVTWHAHIHMSLVLIPPLILLLQNHLYKRVIISWFLVPPSAFLFIYLVAGLVGRGLLPQSILHFANFFLGITCFTVNFLLLKVMLTEYKKLNKS